MKYFNHKFYVYLFRLNLIEGGSLNTISNNGDNKTKRPLSIDTTNDSDIEWFVPNTSTVFGALRPSLVNLTWKSTWGFLLSRPSQLSTMEPLTYRDTHLRVITQNKRLCRRRTHKTSFLNYKKRFCVSVESQDYKELDFSKS